MWAEGRSSHSRSDYFLKLDYVRMVQRVQNLDFANGGDRKSFFFIVHSHFLQCDDLAIIPASRHVHLYGRGLW